MRRFIILLYPIFALSMTYLKFGADARITGMGGAGTGLESGIKGMGYNPASLLYIIDTEIAFTHNEWLQSTRYEYLSWGKRLERGALGIGVKGLYMSDLERRNQDTPEPEGNFNAYNLESSIILAYPLLKRVAIGFGIGGIIEGIDIYHGFGFTLSGGLLYKTFIPGLSVGISGVNIGPKFKFNNQKCEPKSQLRAGIAYLPFKKGPLIVADVVKDLYRDFSLHTGGEYQIGNFLLRCGYQYERDRAFRLSFGLGIKTTKWGIDYAYLPHSELGTVHRLSLFYSFRPSEEELAKEIYLSQMGVLGKSYYNQGLAALEKGAYDEAINSFDKAIICDTSNRKALDKIKEAEEKRRREKIDKHYAKGKEYYNKGDYFEAIQELEMVVVLDPTHYDAKFTLELARRKLTEFLEKDYKIKFNKGLDYFAKNEYNKAEEIWQEMSEYPIRQEEISHALKLVQQRKKEEVNSLLNEASFLLSQKQYTLALSKYEKVKDLDPMDRVALEKIKELKSLLSHKEDEHLYRGIELFQQGKFPQSKEEFEKVLSINPNNSQAKNYIKRIKSRETVSKEELIRRNMRAVTAYLQDDLETAIRLWKEIMEIDPEFGNVRSDLQRAQEKLDKIKKKR